MSKLRKSAVAGAIVLSLAAAPGYAAVISATNSSEVIVDGSSDTRTVTFSAGDLGGALNVVKGVNITIDFMKCSTADGTLTTPLPAACPGSPGGNVNSANEIVFWLTSPSATVVTLVDVDTYNSGGPPVRVTVTFDDAAANAVGGDPTTGPFQPVGLLSTFNGAGVLGSWELHIEDTTGRDPLGFARFALNVTLCDANDTAAICQQGVPAPGTALLLGAGLAGLAVRRLTSRGCRAGSNPTTDLSRLDV